MNPNLVVFLIVFVVGVLPLLYVWLSIRKGMKDSGIDIEMQPVEYLLIILYFAWFVAGVMITGVRKGNYTPYIFYGAVFALTLLVVVYYLHKLFVFSKEDGELTPDLDFENAPKGVITTKGDKVWLCMDFKSGRQLSAHPRKVFTILMIFVVMNFFNMFLMPSFLIEVYLILFGVFAVAFCIWFARLMEKYNWNLQSAFILREGRLYYLRLGHDVRGSGIAGAQDNLIKEAYVRESRRDPETYSYYLTLMTGEYESHPNVAVFIKLANPAIESKDRMNAVITYGEPDEFGNRKTLRVRNGYDWSMMKMVKA